MAQTPSAMVGLNTPIPEISLSDAHGTLFVFPSETRGTLVIFICNHCPFVIHVADILEEIHALCTSNGITMVGVNSNDIETYPDDSPEKMIETAARFNWSFPYLFDSSQLVAKSFQATCTPDVFLYDSRGKLYYRGQLDDSRPSNGVSDGGDLIQAIQAMVQDQPPPDDQQPSIGCNIKWKL